MTNHRTIGNVTVSVLAGHIKATTQPIHSEIGKGIMMGADLYFHITPEVAAQWLPVIAKIANEGIDE